MNTPLSWIKSYLPTLNVTDKEFMDRLTMFGTKVESYIRTDEKLDKIVVGQIKNISKHENADKLIVCQVNIKDKDIQIVTGANNIKKGDLVPVVLDGGCVVAKHNIKDDNTNNSMKIKAGVLRGVASEGMLCSIEELGSSKAFYPESPTNGIYIFEDSVEIGSDAIEALNLHDTIFEYEITSNRVDCFSMLGIAREVAAAFGIKFNYPLIKDTGNMEKASDYIDVEVKDKALCKRFCARVVKNVKIGPSPKWLQRRLSSCGIRPINNIVDITNYVLKEYGQPMHAYDISTIAGRKIVVKCADNNQDFITLDGQKRLLDNETLMIFDAEKAIGIAGIMGGQNSMVTDNVNTIVFEAACFDGTNIRHTSKRLGLRSESSALFEKGLNSNNAYLAVQRACELVEELNCGEVVGGIVEVNNSDRKDLTLDFEFDKINQLLGTNISKKEMLRYFDLLGFSYDESKNAIIVPWFRMDINCMADLAEEVARSFGYNNIPIKLPMGGNTIGGIELKEKIEQISADVAISYGYSQMMSYSFESKKVFDKLLLPNDARQRKAIEILNPLGEDYKIMRTIGLNGLLSSLSTNYNHRIKSAALFEMAKIYLPKSLPLNELPEEKVMMMLGFYGNGDFYDMKAVVEEIIFSFGMVKEKISYDTENALCFLHPYRCAKIYYNGENMGYIGQLHRIVERNYNIGDRVYISCIDLSIIEKYINFDITYKEIAKYPAINRDISLILDKDIKAEKIEKIIRENSGEYLENLELFDIYEGENIGENKRSLAYSLSFRSYDMTLKDSLVQSYMDNIINALKEIEVYIRA